MSDKQDLTNLKALATKVKEYVDNTSSAQGLAQEIQDRKNADSALQTNINKKQDALTDVQLTATKSGITSALVTQISTNKTNIDTKVSKSGDTMTGKLVAPKIETGSDTSNYFQSRKFRGEGDASTYYHAIDFGYAGHNQVDFYEYGGIWNFWVNVDSTATTDTSNRVASLQLGKLVERNNELTYPNKSGTIALTSDVDVKQDKLKDAQLAAVNSGVTSTEVSKINNTLFAYVDSSKSDISNGIIYLNILNYYPVSCLTGDTLIAMGDGTQKRVDSLELGDKILAIDPNTLELVEDEVTYTDSKCNKTHNEYDVWTFEDGYEIKTVHRHRLYNCESEAFVNMDEWAIGDHTRTIDGKEIALISHKHINELVKHYTLFTKKYNNYFANGMLTGNKHSKELTVED